MFSKDKHIIKLIKIEDGYSLISSLYLFILITGISLIIITFLYFFTKQTNSLRIMNKLKWAGYTHITTDYQDPHYKFNLDTLTFGLYSRKHLDVSKNSDTLSMDFIIGHSGDSLLSNGLTLSYPNSRITIAGDTKIEGDIFLAKKRIFYGSLFGIRKGIKNFYTGQIKTNPNIEVKEFNDSVLIKLYTSNNLIQEYPTSEADIYIDYSDKKTITKSYSIVSGNAIIQGINPGFAEKELLVNGDLKIENNTQDNAYTLVHCKKAFLGENVNLSNWIIIAKDTLILESGGTLTNCQLISQKAIIINSSTLLYPSIVCVYNKSSSEFNYSNNIHIRSSSINGSVLLISELAGILKNQSKIQIDSESKIRGFLYCENILENYGELHANIRTYKYLYKDGKNEYINWLVDQEILSDSLDKWFLLPRGFSNAKKEKIISWSY